jgi:hypothetical protein
MTGLASFARIREHSLGTREQNRSHITGGLYRELQGRLGSGGKGRLQGVQDGTSEQISLPIEV